MNTKRCLLAVIVVFVVRTLLNMVFYGMLMTEAYETLQAGHEGLFREVIPAYIGADLLFAILFVCLFIKVSHCLGGGVKGGVILGVYTALLGPILFGIYYFFSVTYMSAGMAIGDSLYQLVGYCISGALAGAIYKTE